MSGKGVLVSSRINIVLKMGRFCETSLQGMRAAHMQPGRGWLTLPRSGRESGRRDEFLGSSMKLSSWLTSGLFLALSSSPPPLGNPHYPRASGKVRARFWRNIQLLLLLSASSFLGNLWLSCRAFRQQSRDKLMLSTVWDF